MWEGVVYEVGDVKWVKTMDIPDSFCPEKDSKRDKEAREGRGRGARAYLDLDQLPGRITP